MAQMITKEDKEQIRELYTQGKTLQEIGNMLSSGEKSFSRQAIWYHVDKMGLQPYQDTTYDTLKDEARQVLSENSDLSIKAFSQELGCSWDLGKKLLKDLGHYQKSEPFYKRVGRSRLFHLYVVEDKSISELKEDAFPDVSTSTINKALRDLDIPVRPKSSANGEARVKWRERTLKAENLPT